jgi:hypothetical protein
MKSRVPPRDFAFPFSLLDFPFSILRFSISQKACLSMLTITVDNITIPMPNVCTPCTLLYGGYNVGIPANNNDMDKETFQALTRVLVLARMQAMRGEAQPQVNAENDKAIMQVVAWADEVEKDYKSEDELV